MSTIEHAQGEIDRLIHTTQADLNHRGILPLERAHRLLSAIKHARQEMILCERVTPADFFNAKWREQSKLLEQLETRLSRIIRGVRIPSDDHEATIR